jgi:eight-cysteine-cluster-containing protein
MQYNILLIIGISVCLIIYNILNTTNTNVKITKDKQNNKIGHLFNLPSNKLNILNKPKIVHKIPSEYCQEKEGCFIGGCSNEICSSLPNIVTPCIWRNKYRCSKYGQCKKVDGRCQWTGKEFKKCIDKL